jgi:hypothetical protein
MELGFAGRGFPGLFLRFATAGIILAGPALIVRILGTVRRSPGCRRRSANSLRRRIETLFLPPPA